MERGFKTYANKLVETIRNELGVTLYQPLDCDSLAEHLCIPVITFSSLRPAVGGEDWAQLTTTDQGALSAMTVFTPTRTVVLNDLHHPNRQRSSLAHELAHALLMHEPLPVHEIHFGGHRDSEQEQQAGFLGNALLLPEAACLAAVRSGATRDSIAASYSVSSQLVEYRLRMSGARLRVQRERSRRRRS